MDNNLQKMKQHHIMMDAQTAIKGNNQTKQELNYWQIVWIKHVLRDSIRPRRELVLQQMGVCRARLVRSLAAATRRCALLRSVPLGSIRQKKAPSTILTAVSAAEKGITQRQVL